MSVRRFMVTVPTDGSGNAVVYSPYLSGFIHTIEYIKDGSNGYTDGVDFTITAEATGETIWTQSDVNASVVKAPRQPTHSNVGVAALYASGGTAINDRIALGRDRVKFSLASGGASKTGVFAIILSDD